MAYHCLALQIPNNCDECVLNSRLDRIIDAVKEIFLVDITVIKSANGEDRFSISENGIGICKEDSDIIIYRLQNSSLLKNEKRNVGTSASVSSSFKILLKADSAPENIQKAKIFLRTHLEQEDDYKTITLQIDNLDEFQMVLGASNSIQKSTFILMDFDQDTFEVSLHGPESSSIMSARTQIVMLLDNYRSQTVTEKQEDIESIKYPYSSKDLFLFNHVLGIRSATSLTATEESVQLLPSEGVDESLIPNLSTMNLSVSEEEGASVLEDISNNPLYSRHFEQALKLGYTEHQISKALHKLGPNCGWNDLLGEVINISADESKYLEVDSEGLDNKSLHLSPGAKFEDQFQAGSQIVVEDPLSQNTIWETKWENESSNLRHIIIDGSNVAMSHGKQVFSCKGIKLAIDWFRERGHKEITAFVPQWRKETSRPDAPITDQDVLLELEREKIIVFTPSRRVKGRRVVCYDDRYILNLAKDTEGIIVSNDMYRDLVNENDEFRKLVEQRLLMYSFVNDRFMPPEDPLGRFGPSLENFLRKTPIAKSKDSCPYGKKCTYGNRCRYYHPERGFAPIKSISDTLKEQAEIKLQERTLKQTEKLEKGRQPKQKLSRTKSLFPVESQGIEDFSAKQEKPKLAHSKSLVFPVKTSDYLNEPRKILEKAELTAARERMLDSDKRMLAAQLEEEENSFMPKAILKSSSSQSSPVPSRDGVKQLVSSLGNSPLRTINSPSHLTVPKGDQPERYLSGHLLLAKKLSNEGNETNFFSEHTSSPSSTRTSSPVLASLKPEQKQVNHMDRSFSHVKQVLRNEENLPNLSIFDTPPQRYSTGHWEENFPSPSAPPKYVPQFSDSGQFSSQFSGSLSNPLQYPIHYHFGSGGNIHSSQEHHSLRRSFSSTQQPYRRSSAIADHLLLKPQQSMPLDPFPSPPLGVCRQNSTSDPQIHNKYVDASQFFFNGGQQLEHGHFAQQAYPPPLVPSFDGSHQYMLQQAQQPYQTFENQQVQKAGYTQEPYSAPNQQMLGYAYNLSPSTQQTAYSGPHPGPMHPLVRGGNPQHYNYNPNYPAVNNITQAQQSPNKINYLQQHGTVTMAILPEDEPIVPDDPRYSIYYHLSNVFGEPVVRKVMNRNPHVLKPDDVCALILEYKQEKLT